MNTDDYRKSQRRDLEKSDHACGFDGERTRPRVWSATPSSLTPVGRLSRWVYAFALVFMLAASTTQLRASDAETTFESANKLYEEGKYSAAITEYDQLIASTKVSATLYFNRGNALYKQGQVGRAIASYRQAELLAPRDSDVRSNLQFARTRARGGSMYRTPRWRILLESLSVNEWTLLTAAAFWTLFILLTTCQWQREFKERLRTWILASGFAAVVFGICLGINLNHLYFANDAIVVAGEVEVRNGPLDEAPSVFKVRDGAELEVLDQKDGWYQVMDPAQRIGWMHQEEAILFSPAAAQKAKG